MAEWQKQTRMYGICLFPIALFLALQLGVQTASGQEKQTTLIGLTADNALLRFTTKNPREVTRVIVKGVTGALVGIDFRPANKLLYGVTNTNNIYTIDPTTGAATLVCTLTTSLDGDLRSGVDFNPQSDRLRLVTKSGQNLRVHADLGAAATDGALAYASTDRNLGKRPMITAVAYTNSIPDAPVTKTFDIDADLDILALQEPPNDGILTTVGPLGVDFGPLGGFDILTDGNGIDHAYAASGSTLYTIDLATGAATTLGAIGDGKVNLVGLTAEAAAE